MRRFNWFGSLHTQATLWVVLPLLLIIVGVIAAGVYTYQRSLSALILSRHRQMADLAAVSVSQVIDGYADILSALASKPGLIEGSRVIRIEVLEETKEAVLVFNAGVLIVDPQGNVLHITSNELAFLGSNIAGLEIFQSVRDELAPSYSNVHVNEETGEHYVLIAVPLVEDNHSLAGALVGGLNLKNATLSESIRRLTIGFAGYAYLVDRNGVVISHPEGDEIGRNYRDQPFVESVLAGRDGEAVWDSPDEGRVVGSNALVSTSGWGLVVKEPWDSVMAPVRFYGLIIGVLGSAAALTISVLLFNGVQRVITPVKSLSVQTTLLASGETIEPIASSGIEEIDALARAFLKMAEQIETYRSGLRKYVGAITQSQEDERRRISRELHDETVQNLLSIHRRLELLEATAENSELRSQLTQLQEVVSMTLNGIRQISKDLRPLMLEDLGLVPALQALVHSSHHGARAIPHVKFEASGEPLHLTPDQELALFRITQEALTNVKKHAQATGVQVKIDFCSAAVQLEILDDGAGFQAPSSIAALTQLDSFGLMGIQERVWAAGGSLSIESVPGEGTKLCVILPVES